MALLADPAPLTPPAQTINGLDLEVPGVDRLVDRLGADTLSDTLDPQIRCDRRR
jgi:hypothetical protein